MDFDTAKENIQPLACGRNVKFLEAALNTDSFSHSKELQKQRQEFEDEIRNYDGDDPLQPWYDYIAWIEQSYPSGGKESGLDEVLAQCLQNFECDQRYIQDRRMIKLYIKFIDSQSDATECYQELYNQGIGTMVADLYICWAYHYDLSGNFKKAENIFRKGLDARAQPFEILDEAHKHFGFTMSQRILHKDEEKYEQEFLKSMRERRFALTSLKSHRKKVGSVRTGSAVKSYAPGKVHVDNNAARSTSISNYRSNTNTNASLNVFEDQNNPGNIMNQPKSTIVEETNPVDMSKSQSLIRSIIDSARKQENMIEPGPWSKAKERSHRKIDFSESHTHASSVNSHHTLPFEILEDEDNAVASLPPIPLPREFNNFIKGIQLPNDHVSHNKPQKEWKTAVILEENLNNRVLPQYEKFYLYPKQNQEYSLEEFCAYKWCKMNQLENALTKRMDPIWSNEYNSGMRLFPTFKRKNNPQQEFCTQRYIQDESITNKNCKFVVNLEEIYPADATEEYQFEEILRKKFKNGERKLRFCGDETIMMEEDMEETHCAVGFDAYSRRSFFPSRKSLLYPGGSRKSIAPPPRISMIPPNPSISTIPECVVQEGLKVSKESPKETIKEDQNTSYALRKSVIMENPLNSTRENAEKLKESSSDLLDKSKNIEKISNDTKLGDSNKKNSKISAENPEETEKIEYNLIPTLTSMSLRQQTPDENDIFNPCINENILHTQRQATPEKIPQILIEKPQLENKFEIYQDEDDDFQFKVPKIPVNQQLRQQEIVNPVQSSTVSPPLNNDMLFDVNESCSTQTFNLFLKSQLASTPYKSRNNEETDLSPTQVGQNSAPITEQNMVTLEPRKLSVILETSEPVTASSGGTTKSSDCNQLSSPESGNDAVSSKINIQPQQHTSIKNISTGAIPKSLQSFQKISSAQKQQKLIETSQHLQNKEETVPSLMMSMKLFEEKTDTIPKMCLVSSVKSASTLTAPTTSTAKLIANLSPKFNLDKSDLLDMMLKSPDRPRRTPNKLNFFELNESKTKLNFDQLNNEPPLCGLLDSFNTQKKSLSPLGAFDKFELPFEMPKSPLRGGGVSFGKFELPIETPNSLRKSVITKPRLSIFDRIKAENNNQDSLLTIGVGGIQEDAFEDNINTDAFIPNIIGMKNSTLLPPKVIQQIDDKSINLSKNEFINSTRTGTINKEHSNIRQRLSFIPKIQQQQQQQIFDKSSQIKGCDDLFENHKFSFIQDKSLQIIDELPNLSDIMKSSTKKKQISNDENKNIGLDFFTMQTSSLPSSSSSSSTKKSNLFSENQKNEEIMTIGKMNYCNDDNGMMGMMSVETNEVIDCFERSIFKNSNLLKIPIENRHAWNDNDDDYGDNEHEYSRITLQLNSKNKFIEPKIDLDETRQMINDCTTNKYMNPFKFELKEAFLNNIDFLNYIKYLPTCLLLDKISYLKRYNTIEIQNKSFEIQKIVGEGSFGTIFCAKEKNTGKWYALKQEKPANLWEYYICLELKSRIKNSDLLMAFMDVEYAVIGNNAGILISNYSKYGSLLNVCNKIKKISNKNLDETIVMILSSQMLSIIDHLHSCNIIHADIKIDNFLLLSRLTYDDKRPTIQLIDFGCSIDMKLFKNGQEFNYICETNDFKCIEMREKRSWTYQIDLYGLAGIIHVLLFGKYMDIEKKLTRWVHKTTYPRYINKNLWEMIFNALLNVPDCNTMPNLQELKTALKEEIEENEKNVRDKISQFNLYIES